MPQKKEKSKLDSLSLKEGLFLAQAMPKIRGREIRLDESLEDFFNL